jgi:Arc/MetJ family transcription regulator
MRTNIVIDPQLMAEALRLSGAPSKRQVVEDSLRLLIQVKRQEQIRRVRGKLRWTGDLEAMRRDH